SSDDSPFGTPVTSIESSDVSVTDSAGVERVDGAEEVESADSESISPPPVSEAGSGGHVPVVVPVDLRDFFGQMARQMGESNRELVRSLTTREVAPDP
ncbi:hypothetical protein, partial [Klebsiella pneumoniae]|uniref:hypothetical protein n=1 Tax=Klebsiella pneumoniae TaxID=573 RepID=UPI001D0F3CB0